MWGDESEARVVEEAGEEKRGMGEVSRAESRVKGKKGAEGGRTEGAEGWRLERKGAEEMFDSGEGGDANGGTGMVVA